MAPPFHNSGNLGPHNAFVGELASSFDELNGAFRKLTGRIKGFRHDGYGPLSVLGSSGPEEYDEVDIDGTNDDDVTSTAILIDSLTMYPTVALTIAPLLTKKLTIKEHARRAGAALAGGALCAVGSVLTPLPTPGGLLFIGAGMMVLGTEFPQAQKAMDRALTGLENVIENNGIDEDDCNGSDEGTEAMDVGIMEEEAAEATVNSSSTCKGEEEVVIDGALEDSSGSQNSESFGFPVMSKKTPMPSTRPGNHPAARMLKTKARAIGRHVLPVLKHMRSANSVIGGGSVEPPTSSGGIGSGVFSIDPKTLNEVSSFTPTPVSEIHNLPCPKFSENAPDTSLSPPEDALPALSSFDNESESTVSSSTHGEVQSERGASVSNKDGEGTNSQAKILSQDRKRTAARLQLSRSNHSAKIRAEVVLV
uniref:Uncharacterized protein n=1 Tax=Corethron hystrix TaxID=216773 RepID=A0A7S1BTB6_9STRA